jgi:cytochrome c553
MKLLLRVAGYAAGVLVVLLGLGVVAVFAVSSSKLTKTYPLPAVSLDVPADEASRERGRHLVSAVTGCQDCHGADLGGHVMMEPGALGSLAATNLTRGRGGIGGDFSDEDWVRAIRHGLRRDGTSLYIMPSYAYAMMSDEDLAAMVAYLKELPPVDRELGAPVLGPLGRVLLTAGKLDLIVADKVPELAERARVDGGVTADYGRYLAEISGCTSCHSPDLAGGLASGPPGSPIPPNLTRAGLLGWKEQDFFHAMREGRRPDGSEISEAMPWRLMGGMTDEELGALWLFLQSVEPKETRLR